MQADGRKLLREFLPGSIFRERVQLNGGSCGFSLAFRRAGPRLIIAVVL
jgi:hypothetical protein